MLSKFAEIEKKWQDRWEHDRIFEADPDPSKPKFYITVPYPYTNGALHIGHGRTYTVGDLIARYKRMRGYNVLFPMASHMTGTPVLGIVQRIKANDPEAVEQYKRDLRLYLETEEEVEAQLRKFTDPWTTAKFFADAIAADFKALGYSIDWRRKFTTGDKIYNQFVTWQYHKFMDKGYIRQGSYPLLYCPNCGNPVGEDDLLEGETAKVKEFTAIKFGFEDGYLVAATLRPETIFGVTNMWIHPDRMYVWARVNGEKWIVSEAAVKKLEYQAREVEVIETFKGDKIIGKNFRAIHDDHEMPILPADFVNVNNATGVVYSVPGHAPFDYIALRDLKENPSGLSRFGISQDDVKAIEMISMIDIEGYSKYPAKDAAERLDITSQIESEKLEEATQEIYKAEFYQGTMKNNCGQFAGRPIKDVKEDVIEWMKSQNQADVFYEPDKRPVVCKCGTDVQIAVMAGQWFLDYTSPGWKDQAWKALNSMEIIPEIFRNLFEATFDWLAQRPCARKRGIGTKLPFDEEWIIESLSDSTIYMAFYTIAHKITGNDLTPEQLTHSFFDYVFLGHGQIKEVANETGVSEKLLKSMHDEFLYWYPNDQRHTSPSHISNHLSFAIFHHVAIFPEKHWIQCISLNEHLIMEGAKMSKSKGNVIPLVEIPQKYGADTYRIYALSAAEPASLMDWRESDVPAVKSRLRQFTTITEQYAKKTPRIYTKEDSPSQMTQWILSKVNSLVTTATNCLENFKLRDYAITVTTEVSRIITQYLKRTNIPVEEQETTLAYVCDRWVRLMAPLTPHSCEEVWSKMGKEGYVSLVQWPEVDESLVDSDLEIALEVVSSTIRDIREIMRLIKDQKPSKAHLYVAPQWMFAAMDKIRDDSLPLRVNEIMKTLMSDEAFKKHGKQVKTIVDRISKENGLWEYSASAEEEFAILSNSTDYIGSELGLEVFVYPADNPSYDPQNKARFALPGRVSIFLE
jgi:leucyl-tRNA synthetase